jgi:staphylococcal nuclease domain-containing protein 1
LLHVGVVIKANNVIGSAIIGFSTAKEKKQFLYAHQSTGADAKRGGAASAPGKHGDNRTFDAQVIRVWSADQISVVEKDNGKERRLQLSSTRAPKYV